MKLLAAIFGAVAIAGFAARSLAAPDNYFVPDNFYNAYACYPQIPYDNPGTYYSTLPNGPVATEDGLVWLNTGSGPALKGGDLAVSIYYENTSSAWQLEETMFTSGGYSGYFMATNKPTWGNARVITNPLIVGSETIPVSGSQGDETFQQGLFYLQFWTDPALESTGKSAYSTYAQAYAASETGAAGVYVAQTAQFKVDFGFDDCGSLRQRNGHVHARRSVEGCVLSRRRQRRRQSGYQRPDRRLEPLRRERHDLEPGRVHRRRHGRHQRPDDRTSQLRSDCCGTRWRHLGCSGTSHAAVNRRRPAGSAGRLRLEEAHLRDGNYPPRQARRRTKKAN